MYSKVLAVIIIGFIVLSNFTLVSAQWTNGNSLGVSDSGTWGTGKVVVGEVLLSVDTLGRVASFNCKMPDNGSSYDLSKRAKKLIFTIKYTYINQQIFSKQTFRLGYKIWKKDGEDWKLLVDKTDVEKKELGPNSTKNGEAETVTLDLPTDGITFKVMVKYDIYGKQNGSTTKEITIKPSIED